MKFLQLFFYMCARAMAVISGLVVVLFYINRLFKTDLGLQIGPPGNRSFSYVPENYQDLVLWLFLLGGVGVVSYLIEIAIKNSGWFKAHPRKAPLVIIGVIACLFLTSWGIINYGNSLAAQNIGGNFLNAIYEKKTIDEIKALGVADNDFGHTMSYSAFDAAVRSDYFSLVPVLVELGYNINAQTRELYKDSGSGQTVLMLAAEANSFGAVKALLDNGAKTDLKDFEQKTALHFAVNGFSSDKVEIALLLLQAKADPNAQDYNGETALHLLLKNSYVSEEQFEMIKLLVASGANLDLKDDAGNTPRSYATNSAYRYLPGQPEYYRELNTLFKK